MRIGGYIGKMQVWPIDAPVMHDGSLSTASADSRDPWRLFLRALLLVAATGVFLILTSSVASALDVPGATDVVGGTTDAVGETTETVGETTEAVGETATGAVGETTEAVGGTTETVGETATGAVGEATEAVGGTTEAVGEAATGAVGGITAAVDETTEAVGGITEATGDTVGALTGALGDTAGALTDAAGDTVGTLTGAVGETAGAIGGSLLDPTESLGGVVDGLVGGVDVDVGGVVPTSPDIANPAIGSTDAPTTAAPLPVSGDAPSPLAHEAMRAPVLQPSLPTNVHQVSTSASRPDAGGAEPGPAPAGGLPFLLDAAAAALSSLTEAGGTGLVWAILALLVLLPAMDGRWLRFVRAVPPHAAFVALDGRPG
jgi:hypothetical protein